MRSCFGMVETKWVEPIEVDTATENELSEYEPVVRQLLFNRGIRKREAAERFLNPSFDQIHDPLELYGVEKAAGVIEDAISGNKKIFIHGDFDVDGICATAILWEYLYRVRDVEVLPYIPDRVDEGYGMSEASIENIIAQGADMIVSVDCGIRDVDIVRKYRKSTKNPEGVEFVITDHHELGQKLPAYVPVVHPMHPKGKYPEAYISGAVVALKLVAAIEKLRNPKDFSWKKVRGLDLAALATVGDLMPLTGENRSIVHFGLKEMNTSPRPGIEALADEAGVESGEISAYHLGYLLGPRINAAGRIGDSVDALKLLVTQSVKQSVQLAGKLGELNRKRQEMTDSLMNEVRAQIEQEGKGKHLYFAYGNDWPEGIIGLVAGKIQDAYHRPVVIVSKGNGSSRGSARSIPGLNIVESVGEVSDLLESHGGHDQAAGFTVSTEKLEEFKERLEDIVQGRVDEDMLKKEIHIDAVVDAGELDWDMMETVDRFKPFGYGNRRPTFWVRDTAVIDVRGVGGGKHVKLYLKGKEGQALDAIYFNGGSHLGVLEKGMKIDVIGRLDINSWNGRRSLQLKVVEIKF